MQKHKKCLLALLLFLVFPVMSSAEPEKLTKRQILRAEDIRTYDYPIHEQSRPWLIEEFGPGKKYPINLTKTTKNIVWQTREAIRKGEREPIIGIIRTFWYTHIKPVYSRTDSLNKESDQSEILSEVLVELVRDRNIMRYKDMGFIDNNEGNREIGKNWNIMLLGEKHGTYAALRRIAKELDCTVLTLGGQPSLLSMEYLVDEYKERGIDIRSKIYVVFVVDYDPAGWIIRESVLKNLKFYGMSNLRPIDIIVPEILTKEELELAKFPLPTKQEKLNQRWLEKTQGIRGQLYGFESDSLPFKRLREKILEVSTPHLRKVSQIVLGGEE